VFSIQSPMRLRGFAQRVARRDRHTNPAVRQVTTQLVEFARIRDRVERSNAERRPLHGNRFDAVRVRDASPGPHEVEAALEFGASGERKHTVQSVGGERPELLDRCGTPRVDHAVGAEPSHETGRRGARCSRDDMRPASNGELNRHRADSARRAEDQHGLPRPQFERVDALKCGQPRGGSGARIAEVESLRHTTHVVGVDRGELRVEAAMAIAELVRVDAVADVNAPNPCASGDDNARPVDSRHQRESGSTRPPP
jgi:hypothetical protein